MSVIRTLVDAPGAGTRSRRPVPAPRPVARLAVLLALSWGAAARATAQAIAPPHGTWRTLETRWFRVHHPADAEAWTRDLATRLDAIRDSVAARVGWAPGRRTTIVVSDPDNLPNGSAWPALRHPAILLYPTPPRPEDDIGSTRGWGDKLAIHEFAHIAHIGRPARRPQWWWALAPDRAGPIALGTPRWAFEGYATFIEGRVTGSGRPHSVARAALLRTLAFEGRLPSYAGMSAAGGYRGGDYAYLVGSAFWDWLADQRGDTAMPLVFRRQTARTPRSFDNAFAGVFGAAPAELYGRFTAEVTGRALALERAVAAAGRVEGRRLARLRHDPGALALSRDGTMLAHLAAPVGGLPWRVVVTTSDTARRPDSVSAETWARRDSVRRATARRLDSLDVEAVRTAPPAPRVLHTLPASIGRLYRRPRFIGDTALLVETLEPRRDGTRRPALFTWHFAARGEVRRVTAPDEAIGEGDVAPDGRRLAGVRCTGGRCDLVLRALDAAPGAAGATRVLAAGAPRTRWSAPRWSPDGRTLVATVSDTGGTWRLALVTPTADGADVRILLGDDAVSRHSPAWTRDGRALAYVTEEGGIADVETLDLASGVRTRRTRTVTSAWHPQPAPDGALHFTVERATGHDIVRVDAPTATSVPMLGDSLFPVVSRPLARAVTLPASPPAAAHDYGTGPRAVRVLPQLAQGVDGHALGLALVGTDPIGRLTWLAAAQAGARGAWRGGHAAVSWRGTRPSWRGEAAWLDLPAAAQRDGDALDATRAAWSGVSAGAVLPVAGSRRAQRLAASVAAGRLRTGDAWATRALAAATWSAGIGVGARTTLQLAVAAAAGRTGDSTWGRGSVRAGVVRGGWEASMVTRHVTSDAPMGERLVLGGQPSPLLDEQVLAQRVAAPMLPAGTLVARALHTVRAATPMPLGLPGTLAFEATAPVVRRDAFVRTVAWEGGVDTPRLDMVAIPAFRLAGGVGVVLDAPLRDRVVAWLAVRVRP